MWILIDELCLGYLWIERYGPFPLLRMPTLLRLRSMAPCPSIFFLQFSNTWNPPIHQLLFSTQNSMAATPLPFFAGKGGWTVCLLHFYKSPILLQPKKTIVFTHAYTLLWRLYTWTSVGGMKRKLMKCYLYNNNSQE